MEEKVMTCDLCNGKMYTGERNSGHSLHLERESIQVSSIWWWNRKQDDVRENMDICTRCYSFIWAMLKGNNPIRKIYEMYLRMCLADMDKFQEKLFTLAKDTDRYYNNHKVKE